MKKEDIVSARQRAQAELENISKVINNLLDNITETNREHVDKRLNELTIKKQQIETRLEELRGLPMVGDVRGKGLMCGIEFVRNRQTKEPFPPDLRVSYRVQTETMKRGLVLYPCSGCVDGAAGDMIQVAPPFIISSKASFTSEFVAFNARYVIRATAVALVASGSAWSSHLSSTYG
jgi:4-aminobutyrate aminotransferase-like enzyme